MNSEGTGAEGNREKRLCWSKTSNPTAQAALQTHPKWGVLQLVTHFASSRLPLLAPMAPRAHFQPAQLKGSA